MTTIAVPGPWSADAACKGHADLMALPYGCHTTRRSQRGQAARTTNQINQALALCATCPVADDCHRWAMTEPDPAEGMIAGGLTPEERRLARGGFVRRHIRGVA